MSDKQMHSPFTQLSEGHSLVLCLKPAGVGVPTIGEGDPKAFYVTPSRAGVGVYELTTNDPYPAGVAAFAQPHLGAPAGVFTDVDVAQPGAGAGDYRVVVTISCFDHTGAALELDNGTGDYLSVLLVARNTVNSP